MSLASCALVFVSGLLAALTVSAADRTWTGAAGDSNWNNAANWSGGLPGTADKAIIATAGVSVNVTANTQIMTLQISTGATGVSVTIAGGVTFTLSNSGALIYDGYESAVINGPGSLKLSTSGTNYADWKPRTGKTLTIHAPIVANGEAGLENNDAGTLLVTNPASDFTGNATITGVGGTIAFVSIANSGAASSLGKGSKLTHSQPNCVYRFAGDALASANRAIELVHTPLTLEQAGSAALTLSGTASGTSANGTSKTLVLAGDSAAPATYAGSIANGACTLSLVKRGSGAWTLSGANTATGGLTLEGGTLSLAGTSQFTNAVLVSGTLRLAVPAPALGPVTVTGFVALDLSPLAAESTLPALTIAPGGRANIVSSVPVFISGATPGPLSGILLNGSPASYDATAGVIPFNGPSVSVPAQGPHTLASAADTAYVIDSEGAGGGIDLADASTAILSLAQQWGTPAVVSFGAAQTLNTQTLSIGPTAAALTLGALSGEGLVTSPSGTLALEAGNPDAALTLFASAADPAPGSPLGIAKDGPGEALLHAPAFTGTASLNNGTLTLSTDGAFSLLRLAGTGTLAKAGSGTLLLTNASPSFTGPVAVRGGTLAVAASDAAGLSSSNRLLTIQSGGALDVGPGKVVNATVLRQRITVAGDGPTGLGALVNLSPTNDQTSALQKVALSGDASVGGSRRLDIRASGTDFCWLDLAGHTLSKISTNYFAILSTPVIPDDPAAPGQHGGIGLQGGTLSLEGTTDLAGSADNTLSVASGSILMLYGLTPSPINWTVNAAEGAILRAGNLAGATHNRLAGPVSLTGPGAAIFNQQNAGAQIIIDGKVSGAGGFAQASGLFRLMNPANDYAGATTVSNKDVLLHAAYPGSLPGWDQGRVTITNEAYLSIPLADASEQGWTFAQMQDLFYNGTLAGTNTTLKIDTALLSSPDLEFPDPVTHGLQKVGPGSLVLTAPITSGWNFMVDDGLADIRSPGPHTVGYTRTYTGSIILTNDAVFALCSTNLSLLFGDKAGAFSLSNRISGTAALTVPERGYNTGSGKLTVGQNGHAVLDIADSARVEGPLIMGNSTGSGGAVYQSGDSVFLNTAGAANDGAIGTSGYGHYWLASGSFTNKGYTQVGRNSGAYGIFRQTGGTFVRPGGTTPATGVVSTNYGGHFTASRNGNSAILLYGGQFLYGSGWMVNADGDRDSSPVLSVLTVGGDAYARVDNGSVDIGRLTNSLSTSLINFEGDGVLHARRIYTYGNASKKFVNFNGGTFRVLAGDSVAYLFNYTGLNQPTRTTLYGPGATFEVPANMSRSLDIPLSAPAGRGLVSFDLDTPLTGYYAPPFPVLNGHGGYAGFVDTVYDRATRAVTGFRALAPGNDHPAGDVTVTLTGGGQANATLALRTAPAVSGGLTKTGGGSLTLTCPTNTYSGPTRVLDGTLVLGHPAALPFASPVEVGGAGAPAVLSLGGYTLTNASVTLKEGGSIVGGALAAATLRKTGAGRATLAATASVDTSVTVPRPDDALLPGLQEGMIRTAFIDNACNPADAVQLTTVAGNGVMGANTTFAGGRWNGNNHTWIYTGYLWNRDATNVTWIFRGSFDDNVTFWLDNETSAALSRLAGAAVGASVSRTLTPGPHLVRVYFGDGTGSVGNKHTGVSGLEIDTGNGAGWRALTDPGDGSFITVSKTPWGPFWRTLQSTPSQPGLWEGTLPNSRNTADPNPLTSVQQTTRAANGTCGENGTINGFTWTNDIMVVYSGYLWNHADHDVTWTFIENFDDTAVLKIDGSVLLNDNGSGTHTRANVTLAPGPHLFEVRLGQRGGTAGLSGTRPAWWPAMPGGKGGFLVDVQGRSADDIANYEVLANPESGLPLLTTGPALPGTDTHNALVIEEGTLALHNSSPGLYEGMIPQAWNTALPNPKTAVQLTTRAGNGVKTSNATYAGGLWAGNNHTWVYSGYLWNRSGATVTWSFWASFDDDVRLMIDGVQILYNHNTAGTHVNADLTPGPHEIEIRYGDGSGNVGPSQTGLLGGLVYDPQGRNSGNAADYILLQDPGDGSLLTTDRALDFSGLAVSVAGSATLDLGGGTNNLASVAGSGTVSNGILAANSVYRVKIEGSACTCLTFADVAVSGLTVMPADAASAAPSFHTYVIATGAFTGKPALAGFPAKYALQIKGEQLVLTSQSGTMIMLR
jgi:autotransporter-associated beta strand protein